MKKLRVYLSKSMAGKTEDLNKALSLLKKYDIEIIMWDGSNGYDKDKHLKLISSCDVFLLLPPKLPKSFSYEFNIGKGQSTELDIANNLCLDIYYIICLGDELYVSDAVDDSNIIDKDWQQNYEKIEAYDLMKPFHESKKEIFFKHNVSNKDIKEFHKSKVISKPMLACLTLFK